MAKIAELTTDQKYEKWRDFHKMTTVKSNRDFFDKMKIVRDAYDEAKRARQNNCYWFRNYDSEETGATSGGGDWARRWATQEKTWAMWFKPSSQDNFLSNVKSPMTTGRIETTLQKFKKLNIRWDALANSKDDVDKAKIAALLLNYIYNKGVFGGALATVVKDALIHGSGIFRITYVEQKRNYSFPKVTLADLTTEELELLTKLTESGDPIPTFWKDPEMKVKYKDLVLEPVPIYDFYPQPTARCLHGQNYEAAWVVRRKIVNYDDFMAEYEHNGNAINLKKVKPTTSYTDSKDQYAFFVPPSDVIDTNAVEVLEYENQLTDQFMVVANDILIMDTPLQYNHKEITYHKLDCIEFPHQFYAIGLADFLMNTQGGQEILMNMMIDKVYESMDNKFFIDSSVYGETTQNMIRTGSKYIPFDTTRGNNVSNSVFPVPYNQIGFDAFKIFDLLDRNATLATQIDPNQMSMMQQKDMPATYGILNKEQVEIMLASLIDNFANGGLLTAGRQMWANIKQFYSIPYVKKIKGDDGTDTLENVWRNIRLEGLEVTVDEDKVKIQETNPSDYSFFEVKGDYLNTTEELDVRIAPDSLEVISRGLEMQKSREAFAQLIPFSIDPDDAASAQKVALRLFNAKAIASDYIEANNLPRSYLLSDEQSSKVEVLEAIMEMDKMLAGEIIPGQAGRTPSHVQYETTILNQLNGEIKEKKMAIIETMAQVQPTIDPATGMAMDIQEPPEIQALGQEIDRMMEIAKNITEHVQQDVVKYVDGAFAGIADSQAMQAQAQPTPQMPAGSNTPQPNMQAAQDPSAVPMPANAGADPTNLPVL